MEFAEKIVPGPFRPVAFSVFKDDHTAQGQKALINYELGSANVGDQWNGSSAFVPTESGYYSFSMAFLRETSNNYTLDDVYMGLFVDGESRGVLWCGSTNEWRENTSLSIIIPVKAGQRVETFSVSDDLIKPRRMRYVYFCGHRVA